MAGPKGCGFAFIKESTGLKALISGGPQERSLRAGTENVAGIVGLGTGLQFSLDRLDMYKKHVTEIKSYAISELKNAIPNIKFNGRSAQIQESLYTVLSLLLPFKDPLIGEKLDQEKIAVSQGSACSSAGAAPSMVMMMVLEDDEMENGTPLRISFCHSTTKEDIDFLVKNLKKISESHVS